jgi:hypothetical protein
MSTGHFFNALSYHPDRLSQRFTRYEALWVAPSASAKNIANAPAGPIAKNVSHTFF